VCLNRIALIAPPLTPMHTPALHFYNTIDTKHSSWPLPRVAKTRALSMTALLRTLIHLSTTAAYLVCISVPSNATARWPRTTKLSGATGTEEIEHKSLRVPPDSQPRKDTVRDRSCTVPRQPTPPLCPSAPERFQPCSQRRGLGSSAEGKGYSRGGDGIESGRATGGDVGDLVQVP
jgi:hypothetical protein